MQVMGEKGMLSLGNPPSSGLEFFDSRGCFTSPPQHSFPQRFREVRPPQLYVGNGSLLNLHTNKQDPETDFGAGNFSFENGW